MWRGSGEAFHSPARDRAQHAGTKLDRGCPPSGPRNARWPTPAGAGCPGPAPRIARPRTPSLSPRGGRCGSSVFEDFSYKLSTMHVRAGRSDQHKTAPDLMVLCCPARARRYSQRSLSLLVSNLSSTSSKASGPTRAAPEKGWSMAAMVNKTSAITPASDPTISACAHVFCKPKR